MQTKSIEYLIQPQDQDSRMDKVVLRALGPQATRSLVRRLFESQAIRIAGRVVNKNWRARPGDVLTVHVSSLDPTAIVEGDAHLDVRFERSDLVVVEKPAGQPTAPVRPGETGTLVNALIARYPEMVGVGYGPREPGIVHRLDTETSGLLLAARTQTAFASLVSSLRSGTIRKEYFLVCEGSGLSDSGGIDIPIGIDSKRGQRVVPCVHAEEIRRCNPRSAQTEYRVVERHGRFALVIARAPKAVRHQIRAHFAAIGHPLVGDALYGGNTDELRRHALHARLVGLSWGGEVEPFEVTSELPDDMASLVRAG